VALVALCDELVSRSMKLLDCQVSNPHLMRMGAVEISRAAFETFLPGSQTIRPGGSWSPGFKPRMRWAHRPGSR